MADPAIPSTNPNPSGSSSSNVYQIGGVPVEFPYKPYGTQLAFMGRVIATLDRARKQGHCHALLESPTGTGKSLSLLCSSLAWQQHQLLRLASVPPAHPAHDPLIHGGGFVPEPEPSGNSEKPSPVLSAREKKKLVPTIYYASRTHTQISQVIREYRKTSYRVPMAILAARKHYCTNEKVCTMENLDEECKLLLKNSIGCVQFKNANKVKCHPSIQKGGCNEVHDIEDLVKVGQTVKGCSYFAAQSLAEEAQLVFCPYSYVINPIVRRAMDIDIKGSILILDEAHNIEDMARDAGSVDVDEEVIHTLRTELGQLCIGGGVAMTYQPLHDMVQGIISWIGDRKDNLQKREFEHYASYWTGDKAIAELQLAGITQQCFPVLQECAAKAIKAASDVESDEIHLSGVSAITLDGLISSLGYFFSGNGCHALDYQLALQRHVKRDGGNPANGWTCSVSLWCLNPAVVFREIANLSLSVILTSGTLSPMGSFASELGVQFEACLEAPHVIDLESQLWAAIISTGPGDHQLNSSYRTADSYGFQDALGSSLEEICKIVPGGALVFFPSYKLLEKLHTRWRQTGQWFRLNAQKPVFIEPKGGMEEFEPVIKGYYETICGNQQTSYWKRKSGLKQAVRHRSTKKSNQNPGKGGAALLAVCRGKVSEGIDFSDELARVVVIVGIPFPNKNDIKVVLKKRYNDAFKASKNLLSGSDWYCHEAFRALNQAAGRCLRHRYDYGAIILLDERFKEERNLSYISKWLRKSIKQYESFDKSLEGLRTFFENAERQLGPKQKNASPNNCLISEMHKENFLVANSTKKNQKPKKPNCQKGEKMLSENESTILKQSILFNSTKYATKAYNHCSGQTVQSNMKDKRAGKTNQKAFDECRNFVDLEDSSPPHSSLDTVVKPSLKSHLDQSIIVGSETNDCQNAKHRDSCMNENLSTVVGSCIQLTDQPSFLLVPDTHDCEKFPESAPGQPVTPRGEVCANSCITEVELSFNTSVNSHTQKRRKLIDSQLSSCPQMVSLTHPNAESLYQADSLSRSIPRAPDERTGSPLADLCSGFKHQKLVEGGLMRTKHGRLPMSPDPSVPRTLHICCSTCKTSLGLQENNFLVTCSLATSSKTYLARILESKPASACSLQCPARSQGMNIHVVITGISSVDKRLFERCIKQNIRQHGKWCEEDGCVFRILFCPFCIDSNTCLGLQVMATDASNLHLLDKVLFYADHLEIKDDETTRKEVVLPGSPTTATQGPGLVQIEKYAYARQPYDFRFARTKSKLKLRKTEPVNACNQDKVYTIE